MAEPTPSARERILDAAEARLLEAGPAGLVLDAVAAEAGVSKGGLLHHFRSKAALVDGLVERMRARFEGAQSSFARAEEEAGRAPGRWTRAYLATTVDASGAPADSSAALMAALLACIGSDAARLAPLRQAFAGWQQRLERDGLDPEVATLVRLAADGLWLSQLLGLPGLEPGLLARVLARLRARARP